MQKTLAIIGCGNLGRALIGSALYSGIPATQIKATVNTSIKVKRIQDKHGIQILTADKNVEIINETNYIILSVKPNQIKPVLLEIANKLQPEQTLISAAAGVSTEYLRRYLPSRNTRLIRIMPNLAINSGHGTVGVYSDNICYSELRHIMATLFKDSLFLDLDREDKLDAITAISGCGPAFLAYLTQHLQHAGRSFGLNPMESDLIIRRLLIGTSHLLRADNYNQIINQVASKGGATEVGIKSMLETRVGVNFSKSIHKSYHRIKQIKADLE